MAYPQSSASNFISKVQYFARRHNQPIMVVTALMAFVLILAASSNTPFPGNAVVTLRGSTPSYFGGALRPGYFFPEDAVQANEGKFYFAAVTDLDELSKVEGENKPTFRSVLLPGILSSNKDEKGKVTYRMEMGTPRELITKHNEAGRGAEFSELTLYQNRLYTFDDRTGDVFEILNKADGQESFVVPRFVITEGDGETDKGMKWEWATVKNGELVMGSMGKAYTDSAGNVMNRNNLYVSILNSRGELRREDWSKRYDVVRQAVNAMDPGYVIIEACLWSDYWRKWIFLPRRISQEMYNDIKDEHKGSNKLIMVDERFTKTSVVTIAMESMDSLKGFSSFAFVPGTKDRHAIALRSVEEGCADDGECKQRSYCLVFDVKTGEVLSPEIEFEGGMKFEGIEFVKYDAKPPPL